MYILQNINRIRDNYLSLTTQTTDLYRMVVLLLYNN